MRINLEYCAFIVPDYEYSRREIVSSDLNIVHPCRSPTPIGSVSCFWLGRKKELCTHETMAHNMARRQQRATFFGVLLKRRLHFRHGKFMHTELYCISLSVAFTFWVSVSVCIFFGIGKLCASCSCSFSGHCPRNAETADPNVSALPKIAGILLIF